MCPDPQILSIYVDGELPSPWKEKMDAHLAACPKCKEKLANYKHLHELFIRGADHTPVAQKRTIVENDGNTPVSENINLNEVMEKSKERVWQRLASRQRYNTAGLVRINGNIRKYSIWRRRLSVPIPIAAAVILVIFGALFYFRFIDKTNNTNYANYSYNQFEFPNLIEEMPANYIPAAQDMNSVLQYITDSTGGDIIILQLPESRNFSRSGEPEILRAADFQPIGNDRNDNSKKRRRTQQ